MNHAIKAVFILFLSLALASPLSASEPRGLLWEIRAPQQHSPAYLFGTIHSEDARVLALPAAVTEALEASPLFMMELLPDDEVGQRLAAAMMLPAGERLEGLLEPALHQQLVEVVTQHGLPIEAAERMKPWALVMILSMPKPQGGVILDQRLYDVAISRGKAVAALESVDEQIMAFDGLTRTMQIALLHDTLAHYEESALLNEALVSAWLARDLDGLQRLAEGANGELSPELEQQLRARLVDERNDRMVQRLLPRLREGGLFVAVGALHLPGETGLLNQLRRQGFSVRPLY